MPAWRKWKESCSKNESLAKSALRSSLADARRTRITEQDLVDFDWNIRVRGDGPLSQFISMDPWWRGKGVGRVKFLKDETSGETKVRMSWPEGYNPFVYFDDGEGNQLSWELLEGGRVVGLRMFGQRGPREMVVRHPENWGHRWSS
eukprot:g71464.t1